MENGNKPAFPTPHMNEFGQIRYSKHGLTKREYACIKLGIPETGYSELDELIRKSERKRIAAMVMQGILSNSSLIDTVIWQWLAKESVNAADELLKQLSETDQSTN